MRCRLLTTTLLALITPTAVHAQTPHIVKDINTVHSSTPALRPNVLTPADDYLYFLGEDELNGRELRRTAGTSTTTILVGDLTPGPFGETEGIATLGNVALFSEFNLSTGRELWRSDGTVPGTQLVRDIHVGQQSSNPTRLTSAAGLVFMVANDGSGPALWRSDGTAAGTFPVRAGDADTLLPGAGPLFFTAATPANGRELWTSDGTVAGTRMVKDVCPGTCDGAPQLLTRGDTLVYFTATNPMFGRELWRTDGTAPNTVLVTDLAPGPLDASIQELATIGDVAYAAGSGLFRFNPGGAFQLLVPSSLPTRALAVSGNRVFFFTDTQQLQRLWRSDGTTVGTFPVADLCTTSPCVGGLGRIVGSSQHAFYVWSSGGVTRLSSNSGSSGTSVNLVEIGTSAYELVVWNDRVYFDGPDDELWSSDGTVPGTGVVFDLTDASSRPHRAVVAEDRLFFWAYRPDQGIEPWVTEGTEPSTIGLDLVPGPGHYVSNESGALGRDLLFSVDGGPGIATRQLWKSDGTLPGSGMLDDVEAAYFSQQGPFGLFSGTADGVDRELWRTDGTPQGTVLVKDLHPSGSSLPRPLSSLGGQRFLRTNFAQLWRTDGTSAGTILVQDHLDASESAVLGSILLLSARDVSNQDQELWRTDGTPQGTALVKDIWPGGVSSRPTFLTSAGGLVFFAANTSPGASRLWKTDGTEAGTLAIAESTGALFAPMAELDGVLYFVAYDPATGVELWRSDGTGPGTHIVKDIVPGPDWAFLVEAGSRPLVAAGGWLWFSAYSLAGGLELWRSDGTAAGTMQYADIAPGPGSSWPSGLVTDGRWLYFIANDGTRGWEMWALDTAPVVSAADVSVAEGDAPGGTAQFTLRLSSPAQAPLTVSYQTVDGTASAGSDYIAQSGTVTFTPGSGETAIVAVPLVADLTDEPDEAFVLRLTPGTAQVEDDEAVATIRDDDEPRVLVQGDTVIEGDFGTTPTTFAVELVTKDGAVTSLPKTVAFASEPLTAVSPQDFTAVSGALSFPAGTPSGATQTVTVNVIGDGQDEPDERFLVRITPTSDVSAPNPLAYGVILDDDGIDARPPVELAHGSVVRATLEPPAGRIVDRDWYVVRQEPRASYELVVDETSGDAVPLQVERLAPDGSVLQGAAVTGTGASVSLRWENGASTAIADQPIRIGSSACGTSCGADDGYRVRFLETTLSAPRVNNSGSQVTVAILQNTTGLAVNGHVRFWSGAGVAGPTVPFQLTARQILVLNTSTSFPGSSGTLTVTHDGPYGSLVGKAVALEPATGFSFDTPMSDRPR